MLKLEDVQSTIRHTEAIDEEIYHGRNVEDTEDSTARGEEITDDDL